MIANIVRVFTRRFDRGKDSGLLLEFNNGLSSRPILSSVSGPPIPIDGGTRLELLLKKNPYQEGGLSHPSQFRRRRWGTERRMPFAALVGYLAPSINVEIATRNENIHSIVKANDWVTISDAELHLRLDPTLDDEDVKKNLRTPMEFIRGQDGRLFGRAAIAPNIEYHLSPFRGGCITISGLRAAPLQNVKGVFLGEALTAKRDAARLLATREALAGWASGQAEFISQNFADGAYQAAAAEVILECGGDIGNLEIVRLGNRWLNTSEIARYLTSIFVLHISLDGDFDFEDYDPVSPSDFKDRFEINHDVAIVLNKDGSLFYPDDFTSADHSTVNGGLRRLRVAGYVRSLIMNIWGEETEELDEEKSCWHCLWREDYSEYFRL